MTLIQEWRYFPRGHENLPHPPNLLTSPQCRTETTRLTQENIKQESLTEEDSGYHSSGTPDSSVGVKDTLNIDYTTDDEDIADVEEEKKIREGRNAHGRLHNPLTATSIHSSLLCCTNGYFNVTSGYFSNFESNCGCTSHNLVDWSTRLSWTNLSLRHQVKIREVTIKSALRSSSSSSSASSFTPSGILSANQKSFRVPYPTPAPPRPTSSEGPSTSRISSPPPPSRIKQEPCEEQDERTTMEGKEGKGDKGRE